MSDLGIDSLADEGHKPRHKHGRGCLAVLVAFVVVLAIAAFVYVKGVDLLQDSLAGPEDYTGDGHGSVTVRVEKGDTATDIGRTLAEADVVKSVEAFTDAAQVDERSLTIQVGTYTLHKQMSGKEALALLLDPESKVTNRLTIPEGLRADEIVRLVAKKTDVPTAKVRAVAAKPSGLGLPPYAGGAVEGYLFPTTYDVSPDATATSLLAAMVEQFTTQADDLGLTGGAQDLGVSPADVVTVASLVQAESRRAEDMPKVARVIYNRLDEGMRLQMDSTLHYAEGSRGNVVANEDLRGIDSPYNTYRHAGLPPGPIDSPGADALRAALHPADGGWRYFVTVNLKTGETKFAETLAEHNRNRQEYLEYCESSDEC